MNFVSLTFIIGFSSKYCKFIKVNQNSGITIYGVLIELNLHYRGGCMVQLEKILDVEGVF